MRRGSPATLPQRVESSGNPGFLPWEEGLPQAKATLSAAAGAVHLAPPGISVLFCEL